MMSMHEVFQGRAVLVTGQLEEHHEHVPVHVGLQAPAVVRLHQAHCQRHGVLAAGGVTELRALTDGVSPLLQ